MAKTFSNVCLVPYNGMFLVQNTLTTIWWELDRRVGTYPELHGTICRKSHVPPIQWEFDGTEVPITQEKYGYQYPRFFPQNEFHCIFLCYKKFIIKHISDVNAIEWEFDERKVAILWKIMGIYMGVYGLSISILHGYLLQGRFWCISPCYGKLMRRSLHFSYDEICSFSYAY